MTAHDIEYAELYTSDKRAAVDYFVYSLGFALVAESAGAGTSALLRQGRVQLIVTEGPATREFLESHGDGIADVALTCDDIEAASEAIVAAGGDAVHEVPGHPSVSGFGAVRHSLYPLPVPGAAPRMPARYQWIPVPSAAGGPRPAIRLLDHVAVCVEGGSLGAYADYYGPSLGLARYSGEYVALGDQAMDSVVIRSPSGRVTFTLVAPDPDKSPGQLDAFLSRNNGPGVQHLAFEVGEIIPVVAELRSRGIEFLSTPDAYYDMLGQRLSGMADEEIASLRAAQVLADRDEWGYLLQLFTRSPYERNTLFYEFIQRRGAKGFGGANIRALYESVERDRLTAE